MQHALRHLTTAFLGIVLSIGLVVQAAQAQQAPAEGPQVTIQMSDALANLSEGETASRDENGNLLSKPGDVIRYMLVAENTGTQPAHNVEMVDPIPAGTMYVLDSATGENMTITYSIDGGRSFLAPPVTYEVRNEQGQIERRPAPASMYTHVKWLINEAIQPQQKTFAEIKVRVIKQ